MQFALRKAVQLHDRSLGVAKARRFGRRHDDHAVGAARRQKERASETGRRVDQAAVVLLADRPEQRGKITRLNILAAQPHRSRKQVQIRKARVLHDRFVQRGAPIDHVAEIHQRAVGKTEVKVKVAKTDVAVQHERFFAELRECRTGERNE